MTKQFTSVTINGVRNFSDLDCSIGTRVEATEADTPFTIDCEGVVHARLSGIRHRTTFRVTAAMTLARSSSPE